MGNMSYCRFRNTLPDLIDCQEHLIENLEKEEEKARTELIQICREIAEENEEA